MFHSVVKIPKGMALSFHIRLCIYWSWFLIRDRFNNSPASFYLFSYFTKRIHFLHLLSITSNQPVFSCIPCQPSTFNSNIIHFPGPFFSLCFSEFTFVLRKLVFIFWRDAFCHERHSIWPVNCVFCFHLRKSTWLLLQLLLISDSFDLLGSLLPWNPIIHHLT